jgi:hypothetical protein
MTLKKTGGASFQRCGSRFIIFTSSTITNRGRSPPRSGTMLELSNPAAEQIDNPTQALRHDSL